MEKEDRDVSGNVQEGNRCNAKPRQTTGRTSLPKWINFNGASINLDHVCSIDLHGKRINVYFDPKLASYKEITFCSEKDASEAFAEIQRALGKGD